MTENLVSFNPDDCIEGGGLLDDVDVKVLDAQAVLFDYDGKQDVPSPGVLFTFDAGGEKPAVQFISIGGSNQDWAPNEEKTGFKAIGKRTALTKTCNYLVFVSSAINCGFPKDQVKNDVRVWVGMECHLERIAMERKGLEKKDSDKQSFAYIVTKIHKLPGGKASDGSKSGGSKASGGSSKKADEVSQELKDKTIENVVRLLTSEKVTAKYPDGVPKSKLGPMIYTDPELKGDNDKTAMVNLIGREDFHTGEGIPWNYDKDSGKLILDV